MNEYRQKKKLTEEQKAKKRAHYRANREEILAYQHSEEYVANRKKQRRESDKYRMYHKFDMQERLEDPEYREKYNETYREYYKRNADKEIERTAQYRAEHPEKSREYMREYMREYRARKKAEKEAEKNT